MAERSNAAVSKTVTGLWVVKVDGSGMRAITKSKGFDDYDPAWSPDGRRIAFVRQGRGPGAIWVVGANGAGAHRLIKPPPRSGEPG